MKTPCTMFPTCRARNRRCRECAHRFPKEEYELLQCPECGEDRLCRTRVKEEGKRCRMHGGASPRGVASASFRHGKYSKALPDRLIADYQRSKTDPDLLELRSEIAVIDARLIDLVGRVDTGESGHWWKQMRATWSKFISARSKQDAELMADLLDELGTTIRMGYSDYAAWRELASTISQRRRLVESERRRLVEIQTLINSEQAMALLTSIVSVIRDHVPDRTTLQAISRDIRNLVSGGNGR